jgi:hypothetical protein
MLLSLRAKRRNPASVSQRIAQHIDGVVAAHSLLSMTLAFLLNVNIML